MGGIDMEAEPLAMEFRGVKRRDLDLQLLLHNPTLEATGIEPQFIRVFSSDIWIEDDPKGSGQYRCRVRPPSGKQQERVVTG